MNINRSYNSLFVYALIFIISHCVFFHRTSECIAASLAYEGDSGVLQWGSDGDFYKLLHIPLLGNPISSDAYVKYRMDIDGAPGWYKIAHGKLPSSEKKDSSAKYTIKSNKVGGDGYETYSKTIDQRSLVANQWSTTSSYWDGDDWYCFDQDISGAFRIDTGVGRNDKWIYTYAPKYMTLVMGGSVRSCAEADEEYDIVVSVAGEGSVEFSNGTPVPTTNTVSHGESPSYVFLASDGYIIESLRVDGVLVPVERATEYTYKFDPVYEDKEVVVVFSADEFDITASVNDTSKGTITPSGTHPYPAGSRPKFVVSANTGYTVTDIKVDGISVLVGSNPSREEYIFPPLQSDQSIVVYFSEGYTLTPRYRTGGKIDPGLSVIVAPGADQRFSITPDSCYVISDVKVDGHTQGVISEYEFLDVSSDGTIEAFFNPINTKVIVDSVSSAHATIIPAGRSTFSCGDSKVYTVEYEDSVSDLYVYINGIGLKVLDGGVAQRLPRVVHNSSDNSFTLTLDEITEYTKIRLSDVVELADYPLDIVTRPAPPNIMFVLDDSGSMDFEFMTTELGGDFSDYRFVFYTEDIQYSSGYVLNGDWRRTWRSQWYGYNTLYYNPNTTYQAWPTLDQDDIFKPTKRDEVKSHPTEDNAPYFKLSNTYINIDGKAIPNAHYYVTSGSEDNIFLVALDYASSEIKYYEVTETSGSGSTETVNKLREIDEDTAKAFKVNSTRDFDDEVQNFANWFTFYRKRELAATAAISQVIDQVSNTYIGIRSINAYEGRNGGYGILQSLTPVRALYLDEDGKFVYENKVNELLASLYGLEIEAEGTPLREGLWRVGQYYDQTNTDDNHGLSATSPWFSKNEGGECQQSFAIAMTDGFYNDDAGKLGHKDQSKGKPYEDNYANTLADITWDYYDRDLVPDSILGNKTPGENSKQHMKTYTVAFGVNGELGDPSLYTLVPNCVDKPGKPCNYPEWPNPNTDARKIDDLFHAAVNGRGLYLNAANPQELVDSLTDVLTDISDQSGSAASVSVNGDELYTDASSGNVLMYQTKYVSPDWVGRLYAYTVEEDASVDITSPLWEAGEKLDIALANGENVNSRIIATYNNDTNPHGIKFDALSDLSPSQRIYFDDGLEGTDSNDMFEYIRGSSENESTTLYRIRKSRLGDIVNSSAHYHDGYLYVGANDGMMHAFDAETGAEKFAYIPSMVLPKLKELISQNYGDNHKFFVDGTPVVTTKGSTSYLVGGLGRGGNGYYSIDISDQENINSSSVLASKVLWEYPQADTPEEEWVDDLGNTFSKAYTMRSYATINTGDDLSGYVTFFGNGYASPKGHAVLYFLNPKTGELIKKIDVGGLGQNGMGTPAAVDVNNDNKMDYIYAGDLEGNMWKFDVRNSDPDQWQVAFCGDGNDDDSCKDATQPKPLVKVADNQAITSTPDIVRHPTRNGYLVVFGTGRFLSTADWEDTTTQSLYGIWDFGDDGDDTEYLGEIVGNGVLVDENRNEKPFSLLAQTEDYYGPAIGVDGDTIAGREIRVLSDNKPNWLLVDDVNRIPEGKPKKDPQNKILENGEIERAHVGWFFDLPLSGERVTVDPIVRDGRVIMISFIPNADRCSGGAQSFFHELDVVTGGRLSEPAFDINRDGVIDEKDMVKVGDVLMSPSAILKSGRKQTPVFVGSSDSDFENRLLGDDDDELGLDEDKGIYYWREF